MKARRYRIIIVVAMAVTVAAIGFVGWRMSRISSTVSPDRREYPIRGVDISAHNGEVDFEALAADSIDFVLMKASEGTAFKDKDFHSNFHRARRAGLKVGAYHFFRFDASGYMQALNFMHSVRGKDLDLPLVIDVEEWTNPDDRTTQSIVVQLREMIDMLDRSGYRVMLYSNKDGFNRFLGDHFEGYPLWLVSFNGAPESRWHLWQYTHRGSVDGIKGSVDINTFNGAQAAWEEWIDENRHYEF